MASLAVFLAAIAGTLAKRVLAALGFGLITYAGFDAVKDQISAAIQTQLSTLNSTIYQVIALGGMIDAIGIWLGALTMAASLMMLKKLGAIAG